MIAVHEEDSNAVTLINLEADRAIDDVKMYSSISDAIGFDFYPTMIRLSLLMPGL